MENFQTSIELFLKELQKFGGRTPEFSIDYGTETILLINAPSGFLRQLYANDRVIAHLGRDGVRIEFLR
jgi:hypothetical protein